MTWVLLSELERSSWRITPSMGGRGGLVVGRKDLDDAHRVPARGTPKGGRYGVKFGGVGVSGLWGWNNTEQGTCLGEVVRANPVSQQPVVANPMEP